jgi:hypothetical protein
MVFKVQDGIEFESKSEWRKYMIETYYSVKNKIDEKHPIVKHPGTINGQSFDIADCSGCRIVVLDQTEQVQIDNVVNCQIFIGASASTVFIRNCEDCTVYSCSRQLRLRECFNSAFYVFSMAEVHIEMSKNVVFAPFSGGYKEHQQHLNAAGIDLNTNYWSQIFDHSDPDKDGANWDLLPVHDRNSPWFPDGSDTSCFGDINESNIPTARNTALEGQIGESFGMDQLVRDHTERLIETRRQAAEVGDARGGRAEIEFEGLPLRSAGDGVKQLGIEVALLIAAATAKGIDVSIWLTDLPGISVIPAVEFNTKLTSLGLAVGIHESWEAKRELDLATSKASLKTIFSLCGHFSTESGEPAIDVSLFLRLSLERVEEHLRHIQLGVQEKGEEPARKQPSPKAAPAPAPLQAPTPSKDPGRPAEPEIEATPLPEPPPPARASAPERQHRASTGGLDLGEPRGRSRRGRSADGGRFSAEALVSTAPRRSQSREAAGRSSGYFRMTGISSEEFESFIKKTVQKTDLYHLIQVHLGYVKPYYIIPPRGDVVVSNPRSWLSVRDLQRAFMAARLRLTDTHVATLMQLVADFAQNVRQISVGTGSMNTVSDISAAREGTEGEAALPAAAAGGASSPAHADGGHDLEHRPVTHSGRLSAEWFRHYMVHLRLHRPSIPWLEWLGGKLKKDEEASDDKPKDFRRALAGKAYLLTADQMNELLMEYELIPEEALLEEVDRRVDTFALDIHGRMDFQHKLNLKLRRWRKATPGPHSAQEVADKGEEFAEELRTERYDDLLLSERTNAAITKELFWTFDLACRESKYTLHVNFGDWLKEHARKAAKHVEDFKEDFAERVHVSSLRASRKHHFAPLNRLADSLGGVANMLPQTPQIQFHKAILALRREAEAPDGIAHGKVVSKLIFDKHFENLLLGPYQVPLMQDPVVRDLTLEARKSHEWRRTAGEGDADMDPAESRKDYWTKTVFSDIFTSNIAAALQAAADFEELKSGEVEERYARWLEDKKKAIRISKDKEVNIGTTANYIYWY